MFLSPRTKTRMGYPLCPVRTGGTEAYLGGREPAGGPAVDAARPLGKHGILLLEAKPRLLGLDLGVHDLTQLHWGEGVGEFSGRAEE